MTTRIILCGKAASGKDHMRKTFERKGFQYAVSYTSRPPRAGEVEGKDYHFLSREEFERRAADGFFYEYVEFNGWLYGTSMEQWNTPYGLYIMTPSGISRILPEDRPSCLIIFLDVSEEIRAERLSRRGDQKDPAERRLESDRQTFAGFEDFDVRVTSWQ